jgi:acetolactate synthase small subunit
MEKTRNLELARITEILTKEGYQIDSIIFEPNLVKEQGGSYITIKLSEEPHHE